MGGLFGKPSVLTVDAVNEVINTSILNISNNTTSSNSITQFIEARGGSTVANNQQIADVTQNMKSIVEVTQNTDFDTKITNEIIQNLEKKSVALLSTFDSLLQNNNVNIKTKIGQKIYNTHIVEVTPVCYTNNTIVQKIIATEGSNITGNSQVVKANFLQSCQNTTTDTMNTISDITNMINQRAAITYENPLNFLSDIFKGWISMVVLIIIVIVIGLVVVIGPGKLDTVALAKQLK